MSHRTIVFWNLARLFGSSGSPIEHALELGDENAGASEDQVNRKIEIIAATIDQIAEEEGAPIIVGFVEIETSALASQIAANVKSVSLKAVDELAQDETGLALDGLNVSLLLDPVVFDGPLRLRSHVIDRTFVTRDVLEVDLRLSGHDDPVSVLVNHWPSRLRGEGLAKRIAAAHYVARLVKQKVRFTLSEMWDAANSTMIVPVKEELVRRAQTPVIVMGDFNDEAFDDSLEVLNTTPDTEPVIEDLAVRGRSKRERFLSYMSSDVRMLNPYWRLVGESGSYYRSPRWRTYDQILLSRGVVEGHRVGFMKYVPDSARVYDARAVTLDDGATFALTNRNGKPIAYDPVKERGCSDHFPVLAALELKS